MPASEIIRNINDHPTSTVAIKEKAYYYLNIILTYFISGVLLFAGVNKMITPEGLRESLSSNIAFLPAGIAMIIVNLLPICEVGLGILLLASIYHNKTRNKKKIIRITTTVLFGIFLLYSIYGFIIGSQKDCGCFGAVLSSKIGIEMVTRNILLILFSIVYLSIGK